MARLIVFGIDGMPCSLLRKLSESGVMPNVRELLNNGVLMPVESTTPEISNVAWSTVFTGRDPSWHGIYGFMDVKSDSYEFYFPQSSHKKCSALWNSIKGLRSIILNIPGTYPATFLNGIMVSGFIALDMKKAIFPSGYLSSLKDSKYMLDIELNRARNDHDYLMNSLFQSLKGRRSFALKTMLNEKWGLFALAVTGTDRLHHFLMEAVYDTSHSRHDQVMNYYQAVDSFIGDIRSECRDNDVFTMVSDHGFEESRIEVALNLMLEKAGYLSFINSEPVGLSDISPISRAFALEPTRIYLHRMDRYPRGCVEPGKNVGLIEEICSFLREQHWNEEYLFKQVLRREEIYDGPEVDKAPDIVVVPQPGISVRCSLDKYDVFSRPSHSGCHNHSDALFYTDQKNFTSNDSSGASTVKNLENVGQYFKSVLS